MTISIRQRLWLFSLAVWAFGLIKSFRTFAPAGFHDWPGEIAFFGGLLGMLALGVDWAVRRIAPGSRSARVG